MKHANRATKIRENIIDQEVNPLLTLQQDLNKTMSHFYDLFEPANLGLEHLENIKISPSMDIIEEKHCYRIEAEMPGIDEKNIKVTIDDNTLTICGEKIQSSVDTRHYIDREIRYGCYERSISLPKSADWEHVSATFDNGFLCVTIPKIQNKKCTPKCIKVLHAKK